MARGRKRGVRVTEKAIAKARKKIQETPKRGRWPKFNEIHPLDREDYIECFKFPSKVFPHPEYGNACFAKTARRGNNTIDPNFGVLLPNEYKIIGTIRFYCASFDKHESIPLIDTTCMLRCDRVSCPYNKKGFITETLNKKTFEKDVNLILNEIHDSKNA
jgi:hypothetical protein